MIDRHKEVVTEPPVTMQIYDEAQAVERYTKLVTEASAAVCTIAKREGFIRAHLESRTKIPKFDTKI